MSQTHTKKKGKLDFSTTPVLCLLQFVVDFFCGSRMFVCFGRGNFVRNLTRTLYHVILFFCVLRARSSVYLIPIIWLLCAVGMTQRCHLPRAVRDREQHEIRVSFFSLRKMCESGIGELCAPWTLIGSRAHGIPSTSFVWSWHTAE